MINISVTELFCLIYLQSICHLNFTSDRYMQKDEQDKQIVYCLMGNLMHNRFHLLHAAVTY